MLQATLPSSVPRPQESRGWFATASDFLESHAALVLTALTVLYLMLAGYQAVRRDLWMDEILTLWVAGMPSLPDVWSTLRHGGADSSPPFFHLLEHAVVWLFGPSPLALRLPAIIGFWVGCLCLFRFVRRRFGVLPATVAMLVPIASGAFELAIDARPYAVVMGFFAMALCFWQAYIERPRIAPLIGLALAFGAAVTSHYYAVLLLAPLAAGEGVRAIQNRRVDLRVVMALGAGAAALLTALPLIPATREFNLSIAASPGYFAKPTAGRVLNTYDWLLTGPLLTVFLPIFALVCLPHLSEFRARTESAPQPELRDAEAAVALALTLLPWVVFAFALGVTKTYAPRYCLVAIVGFAILVPAFLLRLPESRAVIPVAALALSLWLPFHFLQALRRPWGVDAALLEFVSRHPGQEQPIVVGNARLYIELLRKARPELSTRLLYISSPPGSVLPDSTDEHIVVTWAVLGKTTVKPAAAFLANQPSFLLYDDGRGYLLPLLLRDPSESVTLKADLGGASLFLVSRSNAN